MKEKITILQETQINEFYNPEKTNNGGGYKQTRIIFELNGIKGMFEDTSCGEFGTRFFLKYNGKCSCWGSMESDFSYSEFRFDDPEFDTLNREYGLCPSHYFGS